MVMIRKKATKLIHLSPSLEQVSTQKWPCKLFKMLLMHMIINRMAKCAPWVSLSSLEHLIGTNYLSKSNLNPDQTRIMAKIRHFSSLREAVIFQQKRHRNQEMRLNIIKQNQKSHILSGLAMGCTLTQEIVLSMENNMRMASRCMSRDRFNSGSQM